MELVLLRLEIDEKNAATVGVLSIKDTTFRCWTCEDLERETKIKGRTAIPTGRYKMVINFSNRFQKEMPLLLDVPNFEGIRIHAGNTSEDTEGCILVGFDRIDGGIGKSRIAYEDLFSLLKTTESEIFITIKSATGNEKAENMA